MRSYRVIYRAIEDMRAALIGMLTPDIVEVALGTLEVRNTFRASRIGTIAGCYVTDGIARRNANMRLVRDGTITQLTKDHTVAAERMRMGLISEERASSHPDRSTLTRCLGRELIVARDRISRQLVQGDALLLCSDGLYNVLGDTEMERILAHRENRDVSRACRALLDEANQRGTPDNLTVAVVRMTGPTPGLLPRPGLGTPLLRLLRRRLLQLWS